MNKRVWVVVLIGGLVAACGGESGDSGEGAAVSGGERNYQVVISGDAEAEIPPGSAQAELYADPPRYELFFGQMSHNVFLVLAEDITAGTHDLEARDELQSGQNATVEVAIAVEPGNLARGVEDYDDEIDGTITLDDIGDEVSGSFEFKAAFVDTDDSGQTIRKTVTVSGTFTDLRVRRGQ